MWPMKTLQVNVFLALCFAIGLLTAILPAEAGEEVARLRAVYEERLAEIEAQDTAARAKIESQYAAMVGERMRQQLAGKDESGAKALLEESRRFEREKTVPETDDDEIASAVLAVRRDYRLRLVQQEGEKSRAALKLVEHYTAHLDKLRQARLVRKLAKEAQSAQAEIERVRSSASTTAAQFALAAAERALLDALQAKRKPCPDCDGKGVIEVVCKACEGSGRCAKCKGVGRLPNPFRTNRTIAERGILGDDSVSCVSCGGTGTCRHCKGTGKVEQPCSTCKGRGFVEKKD
jgi:hypothetical protein